MSVQRSSTKFSSGRCFKNIQFTKTISHITGLLVMVENTFFFKKGGGKAKSLKSLQHWCSDRYTIAGHVGGYHFSAPQCQYYNVAV